MPSRPSNFPKPSTRFSQFAMPTMAECTQSKSLVGRVRQASVRRRRARLVIPDQGNLWGSSSWLYSKLNIVEEAHHSFHFLGVVWIHLPVYDYLHEDRTRQTSGKSSSGQECSTKARETLTIVRLVLLRGPRQTIGTVHPMSPRRHRCLQLHALRYATWRFCSSHLDV